MKTEVYSWRVSGGLKSDLEREARRRQLPLSAILELAVRDWMGRGGNEPDEDQEQLRLQEAASKCFGVLASGDVSRSERTGERVRERLRRQHDR